VTVIKEHWVQDGYLDSMDDPKYERTLKAAPWARSFEGFCEKNKKGIDGKLERSGGSLSREEAQLLDIFSIFGGVLAAATQEARPDYAGLTHAYCNLLARLTAGADPAPECYWHLQDTATLLQRSGQKATGLQDREPEFAELVRGAVAAAPEGGAAPPRGLHCMTAVGATVVAPAQPRDLAPEGYRQPNSLAGGAMEVHDSTVVKFISGARDGTGFHTAVFTDPVNCAFPPMTLFTAVDVQIGAFEYDGTQALLRECKRRYGGRALTPTPDGRGGRLHVGRQQLIEWLGENHPQKEMFESDHANYQKAIDWFHENMLPPGVESTIYTVNQTLVTVQATYLLPAADEATDLRYREHCSERSTRYMREVTGGWAFAVDGKQLECSEADWGLQAAEIQDAKLVTVALPACAESDIENKPEVKGNVAVIAAGDAVVTVKQFLLDELSSRYDFDVLMAHADGGFGLRLRDTGGTPPCNRAVVTEVVEGKAAAETGQVRLGDCVVAIGGVNAAGVPFPEVMGLLRNAASPTIVIKFSRARDTSTGTGRSRQHRVASPRGTGRGASGSASGSAAGSCPGNGPVDCSQVPLLLLEYPFTYLPF
jgi:hypothetical protein